MILVTILIFFEVSTPPAPYVISTFSLSYVVCYGHVNKNNQSNYAFLGIKHWHQGILSQREIQTRAKAVKQLLFLKKE